MEDVKAAVIAVRNRIANVEDRTWDFSMRPEQREAMDRTVDYYLYLSGIPFQALNSGEFIEDQVYNWTYSNE